MKLSICCITYNHEKFIAAALDSFLMQQTSFDYEIIVSDDNSKDKTREILLTYRHQYPEKIKLLLNKTNIGVIPNFIKAINNCTGEYVAICDGDDYWISPSKLQNQVNFMEANEDYAISSHNTMILDSKDNFSLFSKNNLLHNTFGLVDYLQNHFIHSSSLVFRKKMLKPFPAWYSTVFAGDGFLVLLLAMEGKIHYINKPMSVYRLNYNSISNYASRIEIAKNFENHFRLFDKHSNYKFSKEINDKIFSLFFNLNYYNTNYFKKLFFLKNNFLKIIAINKKILPHYKKIKFLLPAQILKSRVNIKAKKNK